MNTPLVSVLMTAFNREKYIAEAIESVIASTYQNWELIIVDDVSKDRTVDVAKSYEAKDTRIKVYINEKNLGDYPNRNKAASYASGKYLKYVDADDMIYPYGLEQLVFYMEQFPDAGYGLCSLAQDEKKIFPFQLSPQEAYRRNHLFGKAPLSAIINREMFCLVGGFTGKQHIGDSELWHILSRKYPVVLMPHGVVWWRKHDDQQMNDNRTDPFVPFKYLLLKKELINHQECPLNLSEKKIILKITEKQISRNILKALIRNSLKKALELKRHSCKSWYCIFMDVIF